MNSMRTLSTFILVCFFLSGITGLIYEVLWTRLIVRIIGGAPFAISIVLTVFMGGLGLGSYLAGKSIDRIREPVRLIRMYGILELVIGLYGLALPLLIRGFEPLFAIAYKGLFEYFMAYNFVTFVGCTILLIVPVACMGATLPILSRFYVTSLSHLGTHTGRLYGLNTIGAALGALLAGFWLLYSLGVWGTLAIAVIVNIGIALACLHVAGSHRTAASSAKKPEPSVAAPESRTSQYGTGVVFGALVLFAVSGFCSMSYEVIWTKLLALLVGPTTYSFTIVLVTFILGLALGSLFFGWLGDRTSRPVHLLVVTQVVAAILALAVSQVLGNSQLFFAKLIATFQNHFALLSAAKAMAIFVGMILPTFCLGATFPLVTKIYTSSAASVGRSIGTAYALNTIGAVLGSFVAGFVIVPLVGKATGLSIVIALQLVTVIGFFLTVLISGRMRRLKWAIIPVTAVVTLVLCAAYPVWNKQLLALGKYHRFRAMGIDPARYGWFQSLLRGPELLAPLETSEVIYFGDGIAGTTTVMKDIDAMGNMELSMANSGKADASTRGDMGTQTILAHFPLLLHPNAKSVMVIGLASGVTAGEALYYPIEHLDVAEISGEVVKASDLFRKWNNNVLDDPRTHLIVQDGRAHLWMTDRRYDVIISEPSNPWMAGLSNLFTRDHFTRALDRLNNGGMFAQFIHSYQMDWKTFALVGRTFSDVFPNAYLVATAPTLDSRDYMLVGIKGDRSLNPKVAAQNLQFVQQSPHVTLPDARVLWNLIKSDDLTGMFGEGDLNTDVHPRLEFAAPRLMFQVDRVLLANVAARSGLSGTMLAVQREVTNDVDAQIDLVEYALSVHIPFAVGLPNLVDLSKASEDQIGRYFDLVSAYCDANPAVLSRFADDTVRHVCALAQISSLQQHVDDQSPHASTYTYLAWLYYNEGMSDSSIATYRHWLVRHPDDASFRVRLGRMLLSTGARDDALEQFQLAVVDDPENAKAHYHIGMVFSQMGNLLGAGDHFAKALDLLPRYAEAHNALGNILASTGQYDDARQHFTEAVRLRPNYPEARAALKKLRTITGRR